MQSNVEHAGEQRVLIREHDPDEVPYRTRQVEDPPGLVFEVDSRRYEPTCLGRRLQGPAWA